MTDNDKIFLNRSGLVQKLTGGYWEERGITADTLRLDALHPVVSGNKWFKLKHYLADACRQHKEGIVSFGGAWSNHLVALAFACQAYGIKAVGIIRGEEPDRYHATLEQMKTFGMELLFVSREKYSRKEAILDEWISRFPNYSVVPEGGGGAEGIRGASDILGLAPDTGYTHILCAVGTGATMTGLINGSADGQLVLGISSLKPGPDRPIDPLTDHHPARFIERHAIHSRYALNYDYHFGGYARHTPELISFMNMLRRQHDVPTDIVYTGKLFYGLFDLVKKNYFPNGAKLLVIHSGGLLGNRSLPPGMLDF